jgi:hypothetical protein
MAGIDKIFVKRNVAIPFMNWAKENEKLCRLMTLDSLWDYCYGDDVLDRYSGEEVPVCNASQWTDTFIYQYCPIKEVIERLDFMYQSVELDKYKFYPHYLLSSHIPCYEEKDLRGLSKITIPYRGVDVECWCFKPKYLSYNKDIGWFDGDEYAIRCDDIDFHVYSKKALVRRLRKLHIPKNYDVSIDTLYEQISI